jgi:hypothetical protein
MSGACLYWWDWSQNVNIFRTLVRGFSHFLGDVYLVFRNIRRRLLGDLVSTVAEVVVSTCNATLHSSMHTKLFYFTVKLQSSTYMTHYSHNHPKRFELNLDRVLGGQLNRIGYSLQITTEPIGNNRGLVDEKVHRFPRWSMKASITLAEGWFLKQWS